MCLMVVKIFQLLGTDCWKRCILKTTEGHYRRHSLHGGKERSEVGADPLGASVKGAGVKGEPFYSEDELVINRIKSSVTEAEDNVRVEEKKNT